MPDHVPRLSRPVKRFRVTGKRQAGKRKRDASPVLPTPKRWKRLVLPECGEPGTRWMLHSTFFLAWGLVDLYKQTHASDLLPQGKAQLAFSPPNNLLACSCPERRACAINCLNHNHQKKKKRVTSGHHYHQYSYNDPSSPPSNRRRSFFLNRIKCRNRRAGPCRESPLPPSSFPPHPRISTTTHDPQNRSPMFSSFLCVGFLPPITRPGAPANETTHPCLRRSLMSRTSVTCFHAVLRKTKRFTLVCTTRAHGLWVSV